MARPVEGGRSCYNATMSETRAASQTAGASYARENDVLHLQGDWTLPHFSRLEADVRRLRPVLGTATRIDASALAAIDTAGASLLHQLLGDTHLATLTAADSPLPPERRALLQAVSQALQFTDAVPAPRKRVPVIDSLAALGELIANGWSHARSFMGFIGLVLEQLAAILLRPWRWRMTSWVAHLDQTTFRAVPIVVLMNFMVGAVVAFLGATILRDFGATIYTVNLIGFAFLREFGVLLAAILVAGRTASAFAAQIGSMRANEEVDAIRAQGLDPIELLVIPRVLALLIGLPILTFIAMLSGLAGGMAVCAAVLDIGPRQFMAIIQESIPVLHFYLGMSKAPVMAVLIAMIGCAEGFKVEGSAQSVGEHTTMAVVQSIFTVILIDAAAALFFMEMDW